MLWHATKNDELRSPKPPATPASTVFLHSAGCSQRQICFQFEPEVHRYIPAQGEPQLQEHPSRCHMLQPTPCTHSSRWAHHRGLSSSPLPTGVLPLPNQMPSTQPARPTSTSRPGTSQTHPRRHHCYAPNTTCLGWQPKAFPQYSVLKVKGGTRHPEKQIMPTRWLKDIYFQEISVGKAVIAASIRGANPSLCTARRPRSKLTRGDLQMDIVLTEPSFWDQSE